MKYTIYPLSIIILDKRRLFFYTFREANSFKKCYKLLSSNHDFLLLNYAFFVHVSSVQLCTRLSRSLHNPCDRTFAVVVSFLAKLAKIQINWLKIKIDMACVWLSYNDQHFSILSECDGHIKVWHLASPCEIYKNIVEAERQSFCIYFCASFVHSVHSVRILSYPDPVLEKPSKIGVITTGRILFCGPDFLHTW